MSVSKFGAIGALGGAIVGGVAAGIPGAITMAGAGWKAGIAIGGAQQGANLVERSVDRVVNKGLEIADSGKNLGIATTAAIGCCWVGSELAKTLSDRCSLPIPAAEVAPCVAKSAVSTALLGFGGWLLANIALIAFRRFSSGAEASENNASPVQKMSRSVKKARDAGKHAREFLESAQSGK